MCKQIFSLIPFFLFLTLNLSAQIVAWNFDATDNTALAPTTLSNNLTESNISFGSGVTNLGNQSPGGGCGQAYTSDGYTTSASPGIDDYWEFTLTPVGSTMDITTIDFVARRGNNGPDDFSIRYSIDGYASDIGSGTGIANNTCSTSSIAITMAATGVPVTFRVYFFNASNTNGNLRLDNLSVSGVLLPITLTSFEAKPTATTAILNFTTASERDNAYFSIERSNDGATFSEIGRVTGSGTTIEKQDYIYTDAQPFKGINYYRLKQVDFDGKFTFSNVVNVKFGKAGTVVIFPTPASETVTVRLKESLATDAPWQIMDMTGRILSEGIFAAEQLDYSIPVSTFTQGAYVLRVTADQVVLTQQFRKQ